MILDSLRQAACEHYLRCGWAVVRGLFSAQEIETWRGEADRLMAQPALFADPDGRNAVVNSRPRSDRIDPVTDLSPTFLKLANDPRLLRESGALLGGEARLFKDKFIAKPPGAPGYGVHQDFAYWPDLGIAPEKMGSAAVFLDGATAESGAVECVPGVHALLTRPGRIEDPDESSLGDFETVAVEAGDVLFLSGMVPHRSGANRSAGFRRALFFTYAADADPALYETYHQLKKALPHGLG